MEDLSQWGEKSRCHFPFCWKHIPHISGHASWIYRSFYFNLEVEMKGLRKLKHWNVVVQESSEWGNILTLWSVWKRVLLNLQSYWPIFTEERPTVLGPGEWGMAGFQCGPHSIHTVKQSKEETTLKCLESHSSLRAVTANFLIGQVFFLHCFYCVNLIHLCDIVCLTGRAYRTQTFEFLSSLTEPTMALVQYL